MKKLIIVGTGETARLASEYFSLDSDYNVSYFVIEKAFYTVDEFLGKPVLILEEIDRINPEKFYFFVAISSTKLNRERTRLFTLLKTRGFNFASYVSTKAFVWHDVKIGLNCFILENNVLQSGVSIGDNVILWSGNHVGHLTKINENCFIASHVVISGNSEIGNNSFLGVNVSVADNIKIGKDNFIGMAVSITKSTKDNEVYFPLKPIKKEISTIKMFKL